MGACTSPTNLCYTSKKQEGEFTLAENKPVILITGASSGIGEATARLFGKEGYRLVLAARRMNRLKELMADIQSEGGEVLAIRTDLAVYEDIRNLVSSVLGHFGRVDILLNNAGVGRMGWVESLDPEQDIEAQLRVNLLGTIYMTREVLPQMIRQRNGHILNMASLAGMVATPTYSIYAASKFGVRGFTDALRRETSIWGIRVTGIYPGGVENEFAEDARLLRRTGITTPRLLRLTSEDVAWAVLKVVRRPRNTVILPGVMRLAVWLNAFAPGFVDWAVERLFVRREREGVNYD